MHRAGSTKPLSFNCKLGSSKEAYSETDILTQPSRFQNLAATYSNRGRWDVAEALEVAVLESCRDTLGETHWATVKAMSNLAVTYQYLGRLQEATVLLERATALRKEVLGSRNAETLRSVSDLSSLLCEMGKFHEAAQLAAGT